MKLGSMRSLLAVERSLFQGRVGNITRLHFLNLLVAKTARAAKASAPSAPGGNMIGPSFLPVLTEL